MRVFGLEFPYGPQYRRSILGNPALHTQKEFALLYFIIYAEGAPHGPPRSENWPPMPK
jgi:hypothetical protein